MKPGWFLSLAAALGLALFSSLSVPVAADTPTVDLVLGGTGSTPWAIGNVAPGDSGTSTATLRNDGTKAGKVTIWISNISNTEGANPESETGNTSEPGELSGYLTLNVSGANLSTANLSLPATIDALPHSANDSKHIFINSLPAGGTLNLTWTWRLPPETGNDVQGDGLSFNINYMLEELPLLPTPTPTSRPGGGGGGGGNTPPEETPIPTSTPTPTPTVAPTPTSTATPATTVGLYVLGNGQSWKISSDGFFLEDAAVSSQDGSVTVFIPYLTKVLNSNGLPVTEITVNTIDPSPAPDGMHILAAFDLNPDGATFSPGIQITIALNPSEVAAGETVVIAFYNETTDIWEFVEGTVNPDGTVSFNVNHFTVFAVLAVSPEQLFDIAVTLDSSVLKKSSDLTVRTRFESLGTVPTWVDLTFIVLDESGQELYRTQDGITVETEINYWKDFASLKLVPGYYVMVVNTLYNDNVRDEFRQDFSVQAEGGAFPWYYILVALEVIGAAALVFFIVFIMMRRRNRRSRT